MNSSLSRSQGVAFVFLPRGTLPFPSWGNKRATSRFRPPARVIPCVPGSLATVGLVAVMPCLTDLYHSAWSLGFGTSLLVYSGLTLRRPGGAALPRGA